MSTRAELIKRLRDGAGQLSSVGHTGIPALMRDAADALEQAEQQASQLEKAVVQAARETRRVEKHVSELRLRAEQAQECHRKVP